MLGLRPRRAPGQPDLVDHNDPGLSGKPEARRVFGGEFSIDRHPHAPDDLIERASLRDDGDLQALRNIPADIARNHDMSRVAEPARRVRQQQVFSRARFGPRRRELAAVGREHLVETAADAAEVRPAMRVIGRSVHAQPARDVRADRAGRQVGERANDLSRGKGPIISLAADGQSS